MTQFVIKAREKQSPVGKAINKALSRGFFIPQQPLGAIKLLRGWGFLYWWERSSWAIQRLGARSAFQCERGRSQGHS
ncbi:MAG: hypothetical protein WC239_10045 [Sphaerochaetaceae bacterium]